MLLLFSALAGLAYFFLRAPEWRAVDYIRVSRYWTGLFSRVAAWPQWGEEALLRHGLIAYRPVAITLRSGVRMIVDPTDLIGHELVLRGEWEKEESQWIDENLRPGDAFVDVGAHHGTYSLRAAQLVGPRGRVVAVEPNPRARERLLANIRLNGAGPVVVAPVACGVGAGTLTLYESSAKNTGMASFSASNAGGSGEVVATYQVRVAPLDQVVEDHVPPGLRIGLIKIDTEGAESMVLAGAAGVLGRHRPAIMVEVVAELLANMKSSVAELEGILHAARYRKARASRTNALWLPLP